MSANTPTLSSALVHEILNDPEALGALWQAFERHGFTCRFEAAKEPTGWLDSAGAAEYLGMSKNSLHKLTASRSIPFVQEGPNCRCWFQREALDKWRKGEANAVPRA